MKRSTITTVLLVVVLGGLVASTGYAFNLMTDYKDKFESQSKANDRLVEENKKLADASKKNTEELDKQKKSIEELEKKNKELTTAVTADSQSAQTQVNQVADQNAPITDYTSESDKKVLEDLSAANKEKIAQEEAKANEPQYATYSGYTHPQRFPPAYGLSMDELLALNGLSSANDLVEGQSYRVK